MNVLQHVPFWPCLVQWGDVVDLEAIRGQMVGLVVDLAPANGTRWFISGDDAPEMAAPSLVASHFFLRDLPAMLLEMAADFDLE